MEKTTGTILGPDGAPAAIETLVLSPADAQLLRQYKIFLHRYGLKEALYCTKCWDKDLSDGCEAYVTSNQILIKCRCSMRFFQGMTI